MKRKLSRVFVLALAGLAVLNAGEVTNITWRPIGEGLPIGEVERPRFYVGFFLLEKFDGTVNFTRALNK
jgi:hypothetical protein